MRIDAASMNVPLVKRNIDQGLQPTKLARANAQSSTTSLNPLALATTAEPCNASPAAPSATPVLPTNSSNPRITAAVNELLKHWGTSDPAHDHNGDGTVDTIDLGYLLSQFGGAPSAGGINQTSTPAPAPIPAAVPGTGTQPTPIPDVPSPLAALLNQWGETTSQFDLNHDGTVNTLDLGILLSTMGSSQPGQGSAPGAPGAPGAAASAASTGSNTATSAISPMLEESITQAAQKVSDTVFAALDQDQDGQIPLSDLPTSTPPTLTKQLDPTGDGVVTQRGLMQAVHDNLSAAATNYASFDMNALANRWIAALTTPSQTDPAIKPANADSTKLTQLADLLAQRLARTDTTAASATALRKSIDESTMGSDLKSQLLNLIGARFPRGLNVNAVV